MNIFDIIILVFIAGLVALALWILKSRDKHGKGGCPYCSGSGNVSCPNCATHSKSVKKQP